MITSRACIPLLIEGNLNLVVDQLNEFLLAPNTTVRLQLRNQIISHLDKIEVLSRGCNQQNSSSWR
jgi:phosphoglycerate-specific signal transduction histidine kinase